MKEYKMTITWQVQDSISETELKRLQQHIENLVNLVDWPEIEGVSNVRVNNINTVWVPNEKGNTRIKNLIYSCHNADVVIGEIVHENPQGACAVLTHWGTYINFLNRNDVKDLTETVYNNLNDHHKRIVENWDHDKMIAKAAKSGTHILL